MTRPISRFARMATALASLSLIGLFFLPLWRVQLVAPQYPEGLGMRISINSIRGVTVYDLDNINGLNHYIGMQRITPDAIPELRLMPWILGALIATGLMVALIGRRAPLYGWFAGFFLASAGGLVDFWRWEYDYGHDLDPTAAIRIPGASYQPPLLGAKKIMNFTAASWPHVGGIAAFVSLGLVLLVVVLEWRGRAARRAPLASPAPRVSPA